MSLDPDLLRAEAFHEIGQIVQRDATLLVERWCQRALQDQPQAARVHHAVLRDGMPHLLAAIGRWLAEIHPDATGPQHFLAVEHGEQRWEAGWSLAEVVQDYQILRLVLFDYLEQTIERPLSSREVMAVGFALDDAITASVTMYVQYRDDDTRRQEEQRSRQLAHADQRKDEFLAMLAHELRNPLAAMLNALEILRLPSLSPQSATDTLEVADRQLRQVVRLVDDLLDVTRISQGKLALRKQPVDVALAVSSALGSVRPILEAYRHTLQIDLPTEPLLVEADPARLEQVLTNLLSNAAKYTEPGGRIEISAVRDGNQVAIVVADNGVGIEPSLLPRIFDLFVQSDQSEQRAGGGLGIGLALVQRLIHLQGGSVQAESAGPGAGSRFTVRLPICASHPSPAAPVAKSNQPKPANILLVDDNRDVVKMLALLLRRVGHEVSIAHDGEEAINQALSERPRVILLDIGLPGMNGYEVAAEMRKHPDLANCCLVAMTGYGQEDDVRRALEAGFDHHLLKPVRLESIQQVLAGYADPE